MSIDLITGKTAHSKVKFKLVLLIKLQDKLSLKLLEEFSSRINNLRKLMKIFDLIVL